MLVMKSTASWALPTIALSKSLVVRRSSVRRSSFEMSLEISRNPMGFPSAPRRGVITTRAVMRRWSLRMRPITPSHLPSRSAASRISRGLPRAMSSGVCRTSALSLPITSQGS